MLSVFCILLSLLQCYKLFSGVKLSIRSFCFIYVEVHPGPPTSTQQQSSFPFLEEKKAIMVKLINNTEDEDIKQVLLGYIPDKPANEIEQSLNERQITKDKMVKTIKYLDVNQDIADSTAKPQLIKETIMSIERLLPETCRYCNKMYFVKHCVPPTLKCFNCKKGIHENSNQLADLPEIPNLPRLIWLCSYCQPRVSFNAIGSVKSSDSMPQSGKTKSAFKKFTNASVSIEIKDEELLNEKESSKTPESIPVKGDKVKDLCKFFLNGKCIFGISGKEFSKYPPKICRKLQKFGKQGRMGCSKGSNCEFFHPDYVNTLSEKGFA